MSKWIVHPKIAKWGKQMFGKKSPLIASKKFDKIMSEPYSKEGWVVIPLKPPPIDKDINDFLDKARQSFIQNPGTPYCAFCWIELELNKDGDICCPKCGFTIEMKEEE